VTSASTKCRKRPRKTVGRISTDGGRRAPHLAAKPLSLCLSYWPSSGKNPLTKPTLFPTIPIGTKTSAEPHQTNLGTYAIAAPISIPLKRAVPAKDVPNRSSLCKRGKASFLEVAANNTSVLGPQIKKMSGKTEISGEADKTAEEAKEISEEDEFEDFCAESRYCLSLRVDLRIEIACRSANRETK
jgi:hypothetical protein